MIVVLVLVIIFCRVLVVSLRVIGCWWSLEKIWIFIRVFFNLWMLVLMCWVMKFKMLFGMLRCFFLVLDFKIVIWVFSVGEVILIGIFYMKWEINCVVRLGILWGFLLEVRIICFLLLYKMLKVLKNLVCVFFLEVKN